MDFAKQIYKDYQAYLNKEVKIADWIKSVRAGKNVGFIVLNDRYVLQSYPGGI
jgi:asparaginyl-tRNA synthetase